MKILFTGGGSGGHFYPLIAVAQEINKAVKEQKLLKPQLYYLSNRPYDKRLLFENGIEFKKITAGKLRRYFSVLNFFGLFKTGWGFLKSLWLVYNIFPDVIFSNGGNISFPVLLSAKVFKIPVIIHISDVAPGRTNRWASKFAQKVAVAFPGTVKYLPKAKNKIAVVGNPIRQELILPLPEGAYEFLHLDKDVPVILVLGGSGGAQTINEDVVDILPELVQKYQIIHQTGRKLFMEISGRAA
ncbi:MAG: glycosyltransferase, partial [Candidatus Pacebacteria bacterium]|nr:glycosyltransferase [Candidatus Paceibacterota bacterium]